MNKDEKSFADLFSKVNDSHIDSDDGNQKEVTFGNLFDHDKSSDNKKKVSFNSIFDNVSEKDSHSDVESDISDDKSTSGNSESDKSFGDIFSNSSLENDEVKEEKEENSFFSEDKDDSLESDSSEEKVSNDFFGMASSLENDNIKEEKEDTSFFFQQDTNNDTNVDNNAFLQNDDDVPDVSGNIFFENNTSDESVSETPPIKLEENNVNSGILDELNQEKENEEIKKESSNPFFDNTPVEEATDTNPLLLNTLNLVENDTSKKAPSSFDASSYKNFNVKIVKKKEPLIKVVIGVISYAIFIWLLLIGVLLLVYVLDIKIRAQKGDYSKPTFNAYVVLTGSMLPEIQVYDVVVTKKVDASSLEIGDVITFASADTRFFNTTITHRIKKKNYDSEKKTYSFQTKGDNNNVADSALVPEANIYGKVILKIPKLGYLQEFLASDGGWIIVILIPCLAVVSYDIVRLGKGLKRKKYKNIKVQK